MIKSNCGWRLKLIRYPEDGESKSAIQCSLFKLWEKNSRNQGSYSWNLWWFVYDDMISFYPYWCFTDGTNYSSRAVSFNIHLPLETERHIRERACLNANKYIPEPCIFPVLRWSFSFVAGCVLLFVFLIFLYLVYDVITMELE